MVGRIRDSSTFAAGERSEIGRYVLARFWYWDDQ